MPEGLGKRVLSWTHTRLVLIPVSLFVTPGSSVHRISRQEYWRGFDISFSRRHAHVDTMRPGFLERSTSCGLSWLSECRRKTPQCLLETLTLQISCDSHGLPTRNSFSQGKPGLKRSESRGRSKLQWPPPALFLRWWGVGRALR